jgi:hypothetical protein
MERGRVPHSNVPPFHYSSIPRFQVFKEGVPDDKDQRRLHQQPEKAKSHNLL